MDETAKKLKMLKFWISQIFKNLNSKQELKPHKLLGP